MEDRHGETRKIARAYDDQSKIYDQRWASYIEATVRETVARATLTDSEHVLELACGTGALTTRLLKKWPGLTITALDISGGMLEKALFRVGTRVSFLRADAQELPFSSSQFDAVISCNAFHYWRHPEVSLREAARVLVPGGRLIITDWCDDYIACRLCDYYLRLFDPTHFRMYGSDHCRRILESTSFTRIQVERYKISWLWGLMTATAYQAEQASF